MHDMIFSQPMAPHDKVTWTKEGSESFQATKEKIASSTVLALPNYGARVRANPWCSWLTPDIDS